MAFRHFGGKPPVVDAPWTCPTCAHENTSPLKAGCQQCGAGADAKKVGIVVPPGDPSVDSLPEAKPTYAQKFTAEDRARAAYQVWAAEQVRNTHPPTVLLLVEAAFMAGVAWAQSTLTSPVTSVENPAPMLTGWDFDPITQHTILAALAFYRDNQLNYGAIPGQLTAEQVTGLIARLTPEEPSV